MEPNTYQHKLQPGLLLVSKPELGDPRFLTSVSMLCLHDEDGSLALILNQPLPLFINTEDFSISEKKKHDMCFPLYRGGPVAPEQCTFLYQTDTPQPEEAIQVKPGLYLGTDIETLRQLEIDQSSDKISIKFFLGYAGWSYFQLDCETSNDWWYTHQDRSEVTFKDHHDLWINTLEEMGEDFYNKGIQFLNSDKI
jgi:putative transcriptional regulator